MNNSLGVGYMHSDSGFNANHRHHIELALSESEIDEWDYDINSTNPDMCLKICGINKYKDADDAVEVSKVDSILHYQKEAIETQLSLIERLVNLNDNSGEIGVFGNASSAIASNGGGGGSSSNDDNGGANGSVLANSNSNNIVTATMQL